MYDRARDVTSRRVPSLATPCYLLSFPIDCWPFGGHWLYINMLVCLGRVGLFKLGRFVRVDLIGPKKSYFVKKRLTTKLYLTTNDHRMTTLPEISKIKTVKFFRLTSLRIASV